MPSAPPGITHISRKTPDISHLPGPKYKKPVEGDLGTWSHCGKGTPHLEHFHSFAMNEGMYSDILCHGVPNPDATVFLATGQDMSRLDNLQRTGYRKPMTKEIIKIGSTVKRTDFRGNSGDITTHPGVYGVVRGVHIPDAENPYSDDWAVVHFTLGEFEWMRNVLLEDLEVVHLREATTCRECGGTNLRWYVDKTRANSFPGANGPLPLNEVKVIGYLACEECSATVRLIKVEDIEEMLNSLPL